MSEIDKVKTYKNVVEKREYLDTGADLYFTKLIFYDEAEKSFVFTTFPSDLSGAWKVEMAPYEITAKYKEIKDAELFYHIELDKIIHKIDDLYCPECNNRIWRVTNDKVIWALSKKGICQPPFKNPDVFFCSFCKYNFVSFFAHRTSGVKIAKNFQILAVIQVTTGMDYVDRYSVVIRNDCPNWIPKEPDILQQSKTIFREHTV